MKTQASIVAENVSHYNLDSASNAVSRLAEALGIDIELAERGCAAIGGPSLVRHVAESTLRDAFGEDAARRIVAWKQFAEANVAGLRGQLCNSSAVARFMQGLADIRSTEAIWLICANAQQRVISVTQVTSGDAAFASVSMRTLARVAVMHEAVGVVLVRNHPSGDSKFSSEDIRFTEEASKAMQAIGAKLLDHVLLTSGSCKSMLDLRMLPDCSDVE
jgi:hypothetical protein